MDTVEVHRVSDASVELIIGDSDKHTISPESLSKSSVLSLVLHEAEQDTAQVGTVLVPGGYMAAWLSQCRKPASTDQLSVEELLTVLKAADYFADDSLVKHVSRQLGSMLIELQETASRLPSKQKSFSHEMPAYVGPEADSADQTPADMILQQLPHNLIISVIQKGRLGLVKSISLLPPRYHSSVLQAHFPAITRNGSLYIPEASLTSAVSSDVLAPTFKVVGTFPMLRNLCLCTPVHARVSDLVVADFQVALSQLHGLMNLHLEGGMVTNAAVEAVAVALTAHTKPALGRLALHRVGSMQDAGSAKPLVLQSSAIFDSLKLCLELQNVSFRYISCRRGVDEAGDTLSHAVLLSMPHLTSLTLAHKCITAETLQQMVQQLSHLDQSEAPVPKLKTLIFRMNRIRDEGMQNATKLMYRLPSLQHVDMSWNEITSSGSRELSQALSTLSAITLLDIGGNMVSDGLLALAEAMRGMPSLQHLSMKSCRTAPGDGWILGSLVGQLSGLTYLDLCSSSLGGGEDSLEGIRFLSTSLHKICNLQELRLSVIDRMYVEALGVLLPGISLQQDLNTLQIQSATTFTWRLFWPEQTAMLEAVANNLSSLTRLENLSLDSGVQLSPDDARALTTALPVSLRTLRLRFMPGTEGQQELGTALSKLTALEDLNLSVCGFTESSAAALGLAIVCMSNLTRLCLKGNNLKDGGAVTLATALRASRSLREVDLSDTGLSEVGAIAIVGAVDGQGVVGKCWLQDNRIKRASLPQRSRKFTVVLGSSMQEIICEAAF